MDQISNIIFVVPGLIITILFYLILGKVILKKNDYNFYEYIIFGIIFASLISLSLNFFLPLTKEINLSLQIITFIIFFIFKKGKIKIVDLKKILIITISIVLLLAYDTENRPDAYLYHLPYSQIINEFKIIPGVTNLHFRFGHVSIFQYISAFNYTLISGLNGLLFPPAIFCISIFFYFLSNVLSIPKSKIINFGNLFSLLIFIFICMRANRFSEFGNDTMAHLSVFYLVFKFISLKNNDLSEYKSILLLSVFSFLNKSFLIFTFIMPLYLFFKGNLNIKEKIFNIANIFLALWLFKNILVSGCAVYPLKFTCIKNLDWVNIEEVSHEASKAEAWAKGWPENLDSRLSFDEFNKNFTWINSWQKKNLNIFIKKISPYLIFISILLIFLRGSNKLEKFDKDKKVVLLIFSIIGTFYFLTKFPSFRYGYSYLIVLICLISTLNFNKIYHTRLIFFLKPLVIFCILGLILKQGLRIEKFHDKRSLIPNDRFLKESNKEKIKKINLSNDFKYYFLPGKECKYFKAPCTHFDHNKLKLVRKINYDIIIKKN